MLEHFYMGLNKSSTSQLDASSKGSFSHLSVRKGRKLWGESYETIPSQPIIGLPQKSIHPNKGAF
jgi:hypothetical protein